MIDSKIISLPHESLRQRSIKVGIINDDIKKIVADMEKATIDWEDSRKHEVGVALAAIQIDSLMRIIIIRQDFDDKKNKNFEVFINPEIVKYEGEVEADFEGCLSVRDIYGKVKRHTKVRIKALNIEGTEIRIKAEGFLARVFQHEIDHTNGKLFVDHIRGDDSAFYKLSDSGKIEELEDDERKNIYSILW